MVGLATLILLGSADDRGCFMAVACQGRWTRGSGCRFPLTSYSGIERQPSFSPDSSQVAFSWDGDKQDNFDIYVKVIGPGAPLRLTTHASPDFSPAWSPDGRQIAFLRALPERQGCAAVDSGAGRSREKTGRDSVHSTTSKTILRCPAWLGRRTASGSLSQFGSRLRSPMRVFLLSVDTGERRQVNQAAAEFGRRRLACVFA